MNSEVFWNVIMAICGIFIGIFIGIHIADCICGGVGR